MSLRLSKVSPMLRRFVRVTAAAVLAVPLVLGSVPAPVQAQSRSAPDSFANLAEKLLPSVVNISTSQTPKNTERRRGGPEMPQLPPGSPFEEFFKDFFDRQQRRQGGGNAHPVASLGSGFIVDPTGLVVTNNHVIAEADDITVILHDDTNLKATVVGRDPKTDLALLKVTPPRPLPAVSFGDSDKARIGDWVLAIGNPFGLGGTVTAGILSARARNIKSGPYDDFLQTDAPINRGNSGGPLFNMAGDVVGVNSAIYSPSGGSVGIGFSIPANLAKPVIEQLKKDGKVRRGWLGVRIQQVDSDIAESLGLDKAKGAFVAGVEEGGPAAKAKIEASDIIIRFNGREVNELQRLPRLVAETSVGSTVDVVVWRKGKEVTLKATVGELKEEEPQVAANTSGPAGKPAATASVLGLSLSSITPQLRESMGVEDDVDGALVVEVANGSPAADKGVRAGDVIVEVAQSAVKTPAEVVAKVKELKEAGKKSVLLLLNQKGNLTFQAVPIN